MDKRTLEKYEREAKEKNRETWYLAWALDTNQEERNKVSQSLYQSLSHIYIYSQPSAIHTSMVWYRILMHSYIDM